MASQELIYISEDDFYEKRYQLSLEVMSTILGQYKSEDLSNPASRERISHLSINMAMTMLKDMGYRINGLDHVDYFKEKGSTEIIEGIQRKVTASDYIENEDDGIERGRQSLSDAEKNQKLQELRRRKK